MQGTNVILVMFLFNAKITLILVRFKQSRNSNLFSIYESFVCLALRPDLYHKPKCLLHSFIWLILRLFSIHFFNLLISHYVYNLRIRTSRSLIVFPKLLSLIWFQVSAGPKTPGLPNNFKNHKQKSRNTYDTCDICLFD